jgi:hypothetical protein
MCTSMTLSSRSKSPLRAVLAVEVRVVFAAHMCAVRYPIITYPSVRFCPYMCLSGLEKKAMLQPAMLRLPGTLSGSLIPGGTGPADRETNTLFHPQTQAPTLGTEARQRSGTPRLVLRTNSPQSLIPYLN